MSNSTYEKKTKDVKSEAQNDLHIDVEAPPPPYEKAGGAPSSSFSNVAIYDAKSVDKSTFNQNSIPKQVEPSVQPIYNNHLHNYQQQEYYSQQQGGTTVVNVEGDENYKLPRDQQCQRSDEKKRTCLETYWKSVINPVSWKCAFYFLFIAPVIALFSSIWCTMMFVHSIISLIIPPIGFFLCVGTAWSFRALGRLELITVSMCVHKHKPTRMYPPVFSTSPQSQTKGILQYGIRICLDKYTGMCLIYFVFVNFLYTVVTWSLVLALFVLAFSPLMIVAMPLMCAVCLKFGMWKVKMCEDILNGKI